MLPLKKALTSTIGQKFLTAATGIALVLFVIAHLAGNLTLLKHDPGMFNKYAEGLTSLGLLIQAAEAGLIILAVAHIGVAVKLRLRARGARGSGYDMARTKMGPSKWSFSSRNLIVSGLVILVFLVIHVWHFKYGPGVAEGYVTELGGKPARDLHRLVVESFKNPLYSGFYVAVLILLGAHLKHGIWSIFQSLGFTNARNTAVLYRGGVFLAILIAGGFSLIPIWIFFDLTTRFFGP